MAFQLTKANRISNRFVLAIVHLLIKLLNYYSFQVHFGFSKYDLMERVDLAIGNATWIGGSCRLSQGLQRCESVELFNGPPGGKKRVLIVLLAGKSSEDFTSAADALKSLGVKIIGVGMGMSIDESQLSAVAFPSSYLLTTASLRGLAGSSGGVSVLTSQG